MKGLYFYEIFEGYFESFCYRKETIYSGQIVV